MRKRFTVVLLLGSLLALLAVPSLAHAVTTNAFDLTFAGQQACVGCHGGNNALGVAPAYAGTAHGKMATDVQADPPAVVPGADSGLWPSPGPGIQFSPSDLFLVLGGAAGKEYVGNNKGGGGTTAAGQAIPKLTPADDYPLFDPIGFNADTGKWTGEGTDVGVAAYFQRCGGCHNLGLTRPSAAAVTLGSGAQITPDTPTTWAGLSIQCENCHGTGSTNSAHMGTGVGITGLPGILSAEVCGQCHVTGTTVEKRFASTSVFSNPNGYTTNQVLADFFKVANPVTDPAKFYPDGHNKTMNHVYYNEWSISKHAVSRSVLKDATGNALPFAEKECMRCHSAEGSLAASGYKSSYFDSYTPAPSTDQYDITCPVCHTVHDPSKPSDALGLRVDKNDVCSQCHNAEIETDGDIQEGAPVHHPEKEMVQGYGLLDVPDMAPSMGSATCVDCHMPATKTGRLSHVFTPMLPGNAEAWGVPEFGDSCTPCHKTMSRTTLQGDIDGWQAEVKAGIADVKTVLAAAAALPGTPSEFDTAMTGHASSNNSFVEADGSFGVHNIAYARAGLAKALYFAKAVGSALTATIPATATAGSEITISGKLTLGDGTSKAGETITIEKKRAGFLEILSVATATTSAKGEFSVKIKPGSTGEYTAVWEPSSGAQLKTAQQLITVDLGTPLFTDVPADSIFFTPIQGLAKLGVVNGLTADLFGPDALLKRAQTAKMLVNAFGYGNNTWTNWDNPTFIDVPRPATQTEADRYPFDDVEKAKAAGIVNGVTATMFMPWNDITRAQLALMIVRIGGDTLVEPTQEPPFTDLDGQSQEAREAIAIAFANGIIGGKTETTFDPEATATRGQAAKMIWNLAGLMGQVQ
jgi:predicted CXXCH cytochrome family protein